MKLRYKMYNEKIEADLICNPKHFWAYALKSDKKGRVPNTMIYDNIVSYHTETIINNFASFFSESFVLSTIPLSFLDNYNYLEIIHLLMLISL